MTNLTIESMANTLNLHMTRIGAEGLSFDVSDEGLLSLADESGYYSLTKDYQECLIELESIEDEAIQDLVYDGDDHHVWDQIWELAK